MREERVLHSPAGYEAGEPVPSAPLSWSAARGKLRVRYARAATRSVAVLARRSPAATPAWTTCSTRATCSATMFGRRSAVRSARRMKRSASRRRTSAPARRGCAPCGRRARAGCGPVAAALVARDALLGALARGGRRAGRSTTSDSARSRDGQRGADGDERRALGESPPRFAVTFAARALACAASRVSRRGGRAGATSGRLATAPCVAVGRRAAVPARVARLALVPVLSRAVPALLLRRRRPRSWRSLVRAGGSVGGRRPCGGSASRCGACLELSLSHSSNMRTPVCTPHRRLCYRLARFLVKPRRTCTNFVTNGTGVPRRT